jgi:hypothetical protein
MPKLQRFQQVVDYAEAQADGGGEVLPVDLAPEVQDLEDVWLNERFGQTGFLKRLGFLRD